MSCKLAEEVQTTVFHVEVRGTRRTSSTDAESSQKIFRMPVHMPRLQLRRRVTKGSADDLSRAIISGVWGLSFGQDVHYFTAYTDHCKDLLEPLSRHSSSHINRDDIINLVEIVRRNGDMPIAKIRDEIRAANPMRMTAAADDDSNLAPLEFVIRLWLFVKPDLEDGTRTLSQVVAAALPESKHFPVNSGPLTRDFCAKSLTRKGGIKIEWTSYLSEHLTFVGKARMPRLRVFRHVSVLQKYAQSQESLPYPEHFLLETEMTLSLLFPTVTFETLKRTRRIGKKNHVDIEAAIEASVASCGMLDLDNYPYWQERLREVQKVYDDARPTTLKQLWFDRRNRLEWASVWTSIAVFILNFGFISTVTGIMQVYAAFKALH